MTVFVLRPGDLDDPGILVLLGEHVEHMRTISPPGTSYALDAQALTGPEVTFVTAWDGDALVGCGALKDLGHGCAEIKSMRTRPSHLRRGVATRVLEYLLAVARARGYRRVSLETGTSAAFAPAIALYHRFGFREGEPFAEYRESPHNQFFHLDT